MLRKLSLQRCVHTYGGMRHPRYVVIGLRRLQAMTQLPHELLIHTLDSSVCVCGGGGGGACVRACVRVCVCVCVCDYTTTC